MKYQAIVGLEIHMQLDTKSKLFSSAPVSYGSPANTLIAPLDMAFPGALPTVNKSAVISAIKLAHALNMHISETITFDRKNYFYSDLAKGYQLMQHFNPLGRNGKVTISTSAGNKVIHITQLHLEEDTAKQIHTKNETYLDFNRSGIGLIEIVSAPDLNSGEEAEQFARFIRKLALKLKISTGKMQEGAMRVDVNVSLQKAGSLDKGVVVEIKNLNSFKNIHKAVDAEVLRQINLLEKGVTLYPETRRYDEKQEVTIFMRNKQQKEDYHYFPDTNIAPIKITQDLLDECLSEEKTKDETLDKYPLTSSQKTTLLSHPYLQTLFVKLLNNGVSGAVAANFLTSKTQAVIKKDGVNNLKKIEADTIALLTLYQQQKISSKQLSAFYEQLLDNKLLKDIYNSDDDSLIQSEKELMAIIDSVLMECTEAIKDYRLGKDKSLNYILGQIYKKSNNKADPKTTKQLLLKKLEE
ncbi:MAG: Asp-tRNA(Asn)/Glu-tRNA(Gln) amidotransferase subunit GatB [Erysipelotrichaceae bacterium]|jgi:aspartyl-tRNA(Asn)/glutamyl-tRNA(Gln) amidotransferase subunit B|nr:Asp-tRNA(Asn)/Glu-tRNA(Gln) amidotransferase subunit GatB [Erysipelotrichaceae bacterium]